MNGLKKDTTLNEQDSLQDILLLEKSLVKLYGEAITEGASKEYRTAIKNNFTAQATDQFNVFEQMSKQGYYQVKPAEQTIIEENKSKFKTVKTTLC